MTEGDKSLARLQDVAVAFVLLSRFPVPALPDAAQERGARAAWAWPIAGLGVGLTAALFGWAASALGAGAGVAAGIILAAQAMLTGAMHEDGLADTFDGLWGGHDRARRLEIMKDSRVGSYGVIALILSILIRWSALSALIGAGWIFAPVIAAAMLSRAPMPAVMELLPNARGSGLSDSVGRPSRDTALLAIAVALGAAFVLTGWGALCAAFWVTLATTATALIARAKIGGQTGDILGAAQQLSEIAALAAFAAMA